MKAKWILILSALLVLSCKKSANENAAPVVPEEQERIPINIATAVTRVTDTAFEKGDAVGLYVVNQPSALASSGNHADNVKFTFDGEKWVAEQELYWLDEKTPADFYAYYPYTGEVADVQSISVSVKADQSKEEGYKSSEFLLGKTLGVAPTPDPVHINTKHLMSLLRVELKAGTGWTDEDINAASVSLLGLKTAAKVNLKDATITAEGESSEITPLSLGGGVYKALVVPQNVTEADLIKIKVGNNDYILKTSVNLVSGKQHKCTIVVNRTSEGINIGVDPWEDGDVYSGIVE